MRILLVIFGAALLAGLPSTVLAGDLYEEEPILYSETPSTNAITRLEDRWRAGELTLGRTDRDIVEIILKELDIPVDSQILVFSKTSLQRSMIDPRHPRAIYFSDDCYIGWCPGGLVEVTIMDPNLGPIFYAFDPRTARSKKGPRFVRDRNCLSCHGGHFVRGIPSVFARTVPTDPSGEPLLHLGSKVVDYRTPFEERWGGWYVSGRHGEGRHQGNVFSRDDGGQLIADVETGANLTDLSRFFDTSTYLAKTSDLIALMIFEHQIAMHNTLTRASFDARRMLRYQRNLQKELGEPITDDLAYDSVKRIFESRSQEVVDHLLFFEEAELPKGGIEGIPSFQEAFSAKAPRSQQGHSLKDLHLGKRIFENRCSYLIYSAGFRALPGKLKEIIIAKLEKALHPDPPDDRYYYIRSAERARIAGILRETHPDFPKDWLLNP